MKARFLHLMLIALAFLVMLPQTPAAGQPGVTALANPVYLPIVTKPLTSCSTNQTYGSFPTSGGNDGIPAALHPDKNLAVRGYVLDSGGGLGFTALGPQDHDPTAPQLSYLFGTPPVLNPTPFAHAYQVYDWVWGAAPTYGHRGALLDVTMIGIKTKVGDQIRLPVRLNGDFPVAEYPQGTKYYGMVIYADATRITIVYTSRDSVVNQNGQGYALHVEKFCVDPVLLALYNQLDSAGRGSLPGLYYNQPFGIASSTEVDVATRDSGSFRDPRNQGDWWIP